MTHEPPVLRSPRSGRLEGKFSRSIRSEGSIAAAMAIMNVGTYGFQMAATRILGPVHYGTLASLMNALLVIGVLQLGLQATAARRIASDPAHVKQIERVALRVTNRAALGFGALLLLASPAVNWALKLGDWRVAVLLAVSAVPMTITGCQAGVLQGERRWWPLAVQYVAAGVPRLIIGGALMWFRPTEFYAILGVTLANFVPVLIGMYALRRKRSGDRESDDHAHGHVIREAIHNSQALLAFMALSNADLAVVARHVLNAHDTGLYAAGVIVSKVVLFLPQFVVVTAFPTLATPRERRRALLQSLTWVGVIGVISTAGSFVLSALALFFIGGPKYSGVQGDLWIFAILGTILAALQLLTFAVLARQGRKSILVLWGGLIALLVFGRMTSSLPSLVWTVVAVDGAILAILIALGLKTSSESALKAEAAPAA